MSELRALLLNRRFLLPFAAEQLLGLGYTTFLVAFLLSIAKVDNYMSLSLGLMMWGQGAYVGALLVGGALSSRFGHQFVARLTLLLYAAVPVAACVCLHRPAWLAVVAVVAGAVAGIASPGARVDMYDVLPRERLQQLYLPLYMFSMLQTVGYAVGGLLFRVNPTAPFYAASALILAAFITYLCSPTRRIVCEGEEDLTLGKTLGLLRVYASPELMTLAGLATLLAMGNALFYISGVFRLLQTSEAGVSIGLAVAGILLLTVVVQHLLRRAKGIPLVYAVAPLPVLAVIAMLGFERPGVLIATWVAFALCTFNARIGVFAKLYSFVRVESALQLGMTQLLSTAGVIASAILLQAMHSRQGLALSFGAYAILWLVFALAVWLNGMKRLLMEGTAPPAMPTAATQAPNA